jgi:hypothetical protein
MHLTPIDAERFWSKVDQTGDCWLWTSARHRAGYGAFWVPSVGRMIRAHRVAWALAHGDPGINWVLHHCDNPPCVRLEHLFLGDAKANAQDMANKGRANLQRPGVRRIGEAHQLSVLTDVQIREAREQYAETLVSQRVLAQQLGIAQASLSKILRGDTRAEAGGPFTQNRPRRRNSCRV